MKMRVQDKKGEIGQRKSKVPSKDYEWEGRVWFHEKDNVKDEKNRDLILNEFKVKEWGVGKSLFNAPLIQPPVDAIKVV